MPRISAKSLDYQLSDFRKFIRDNMYEKKIRQEHLAELLGIKQSAFSNRMRKNFFTVKDIMILFRELDASDEDILKTMRPRRKS